ncbi:MAG: 4Fe-4S binding protein [Desulfobacterales bacterium]
MAHYSTGQGYHRFVHRLNRFPQGAPPSKSLFNILRILIDEEEAGLLSMLPLLPFRAEKAASVWKMKTSRAQNLLDGFSGRALLLDMVNEKRERYYVLPPPMAGFFEFSMMRFREDIDQKLLAKYFYQYINEEVDFIRALFPADQVGFGRVFVHEPALEDRQRVEILDYEKAGHIIETARCIGVGLCYCRHKMAHVGKDCDTPKDMCLTLGFVAESLIRHEFARKIGASEAMDILQAAYALNLVQCGENVRQGVSFICNCCKCCCEGLIAARTLGHSHPIWTTNFFPQPGVGECSGCGTCMNVCPVDAVSVHAAEGRSEVFSVEIDLEICLGCGICVRNCPTGAIRLTERSERIITPVDSIQRTILMAIEQGLLQNLVFDNPSLMHHRAMAALFGAVLRLTPVKQALAARQLQSRWLDAVINIGAHRSGWIPLFR